MVSALLVPKDRASYLAELLRFKVLKRGVFNWGNITASVYWRAKRLKYQSVEELQCSNKVLKRL